MKYKYHYIVIAVLVLTMTLGITFMNIFVYGSVLKANLSILPLALIIPLYVGFKEKKYAEKVVGVMWVYLTVIVIACVLIVPKMTYQEAFNQFDEPIKTLRKHTGEATMFYKGDYYVKTNKGSFKIDLKNGEIIGVEDEYN